MFEQFVKAGLRFHCKRAFLARQINLYHIHFKSSRNASIENQNVNDDDLDKPLKYSTSEASSWRAEKSRNPLADRHPYESDIISLSLLVFLIYFLVLREENDIDSIFDRELSDYVPITEQRPVSYSK